MNGSSTGLPRVRSSGLKTTETKAWIPEELLCTCLRAWEAGETGVVGVFAASAFNPREIVRLKDETTISLASYAARMQLLKAADFNEKAAGAGLSKRSDRPEGVQNHQG